MGEIDFPYWDRGFSTVCPEALTSLVQLLKAKLTLQNESQNSAELSTE